MTNDTIDSTSTSVQEYLRQVLQLKKMMHGLDAADQDDIWIETYKEWTRREVTPRDLPGLLALIHPDFFSKKGRSFEDYEKLSYKNTHRFRADIGNIDDCQAVKYLGTECIFNSHKHLRGKCEADHVWPHSLGGPSIPENRLLLCKFHNGMKSYNVYHFEWEELPSWLLGYLKTIYLLKL